MGVRIFPGAVLLAVSPITSVFAAISPCVFAKTMFLVILILSVILPAIRPLEHPSPIHLVILEVAVKLSIV